MHTCVYVCIYSCVHICHHLFAGSPAATHIVAKATQTFPFFFVFSLTNRLIVTITIVF